MLRGISEGLFLEVRLSFFQGRNQSVFEKGHLGLLFEEESVQVLEGIQAAVLEPTYVTVC